MTTLYLDTEFNGFGGELISMALVPDDESRPYWYGVTALPVSVHPWVRENVIPVLNKEPIRFLLFKESFQRYISQFKNPLIVCDWYADAIHFCSLMNGHTHDSSLAIEFTVKVVHTRGVISTEPHNALADAQGLRAWYRNNHEQPDYLRRSMNGQDIGEQNQV